MHLSCSRRFALIDGSDGDDRLALECRRKRYGASTPGVVVPVRLKACTCPRESITANAAWRSGARVLCPHRALPRGLGVKRQSINPHFPVRVPSRGQRRLSNRRARWPRFSRSRMTAPRSPLMRPRVDGHPSLPGKAAGRSLTDKAANCYRRALRSGRRAHIRRFVLILF
jgi:hypothetical protein